MKKIIDENEEKKILESYERGEWHSVKNLKAEVLTLRTAARNTMQKDKRINIRMSSRDLNQVQVIAAQEGIPYQTLISSIIHKYVSGSLTDRRRV
jgi:predicted DNA binding CopG/RHH family protein